MKFGALIIIFLSSSVARVEAQSSGHALAGIGTASCGKYIADKSIAGVENMLVSWVQGYLSGMNVAENAITKEPFVLLPDSDSIALYIDKYCRDNPLESPIGGAIQLYHDLRLNAKH